MPQTRELTADKRSPLPALTGIRIFAAYYVVMLHTGAGYFGRNGAPPAVLRLLDKGYLAVSLFSSSPDSFLSIPIKEKYRERTACFVFGRLGLPEFIPFICSRSL